MSLKSPIAALLLIVLVATPAFAQGRGRGGGGGAGGGGGGGEHASPPGHDVTVTSSPATPLSRAAYLRSWLDDASVIGPGAVWAAVSFVAAQGGQRYFPVLDMAVGASRRAHVGASVPVSRIDDGAGGTASSVGQVYFYGKWMLRDASIADDRLGVAVTPVIEIARSEIDTSRDVSLGVPVNLEVRHGAIRAYGSVGFFTRGAFFQSAALEVTAGPRVAVTGTVGHTYSTLSDESGETLGLHRTDLGVGASVSLSRALAVFGAVGRSMVDEFGTTWVAGGLSVFGGGR